MEAKIDAWLKTYLNEMLISPVDWEDLPEDCRIQLDNFARDEAVRRADSFANEGVLDLSHQDAIRQMVDAMAQAWKLPGDKVRQIVEDFYDALPAQPGEEFEKLAIRLYRRTASYSWHEIMQTLDSGENTSLVDTVVKHADLPADAGLDKTSFLKGMRYSYDSWTLSHPKDAVNEAIDTLDIGNESSIKLPDLLPLIQKRGASTWTRALELELEVDVESASRDDLIRILKRYALIVRREGGLQPPKEETASGQPIDSDPPMQAVVAEPEETTAPDQDTPDNSDEITEHGPESMEVDTVTETDEAEEEEPLAELSNSESEKDPSPDDEAPIAVEEDASDIEDETKPSSDNEVPESNEESELEAKDQAKESVEPSDADPDVELTGEDKDALDSMFGEVDEDDLPDVARSYWEEQNGSSESDLTEEPDDTAEADDEQLEQIDSENDEEVVNTDVSDDSADDIGEDSPDESPEETEETGESEEELNPTPSISALDEEPKTRLQDVFVPSPQGDDRDRFAKLRSGDLRDKIVREMYEGDATMLDVFLAKLSGAPDWNRAKQFIANEFFRCKLDLHSELGETFFLELKDSLRD